MKELWMLVCCFHVCNEFSMAIRCGKLLEMLKNTISILLSLSMVTNINLEFRWGSLTNLAFHPCFILPTNGQVWWKRFDLWRAFKVTIELHYWTKIVTWLQLRSSIILTFHHFIGTSLCIQCFSVYRVLYRCLHLLLLHDKLRLLW